MRKGWTFIFIIVFIFNNYLFSQTDSLNNKSLFNEFFIIDQFSECDCEGIDSNTIEIASKLFTRKILQENEIQEIKKWNLNQQTDFFKNVYSLGCFFTKYKHPNGEYYDFPYNTVCPAFEFFLQNESFHEVPLKSSDDFYLEINIHYSLHILHYGKYEEKKIIISGSDETNYTLIHNYKDNGVIYKDTFSSIIENGEELENIILNDFKIMNIPSDKALFNYQKSFISYFTTFKILNKGGYNKFTFGDLSSDCGPVAKRVKRILKEIEDQLDVDLKIGDKS